MGPNEPMDLEGPEVDGRPSPKHGNGQYIKIITLSATFAGCVVLGLTIYFEVRNPNASGAPLLNAGAQEPSVGQKRPPPGGWNYPVCYMNDYRPQDYTKYGGIGLMDALRYTAGNVGNIVWMHGASLLLKEPLQNPFIHNSWLDDDRLTTYGFKMLYFPVSNIFTNISVCGRPGIEMVRGSPEWAIERTAHAVRSVKGPTLFVGAGTNGFFALTDRPRLVHDLQPGRVNDTVNQYKLCGVHLNLLKTVTEQKGYILSRGNFTTTVLRRHGFKRVYSTGCPSLFSDPRPGLGLRIHEKLEFLKKRLLTGMLAPHSIKVAVGLPPYFKPKMIGLLLKVLLANPLNRLIIQDERDENTLIECKKVLKLEVPQEQKIFFTSLAAWEEYMTQFDFFLGGRIHGGMTGLQRGVPGFLIAPDMRVLEMAEIMKVPFADVYDERLRKDDLTIADIVEMVKFDGYGFDRNRCVLYRHYEFVFNELRLEINPELAQVCDGYDIPVFNGKDAEMN